MKLKRILTVFLCLVLLLSMAGCGAAGKSESSAVAPNEMADNAAGLTKEEASTDISLPENRKLIQTVTMSAETEDLDALLTQINTRITQLEGYVEGQNIYNGSAYGGSRYRNAELTVRIPAEQLDAFVEQVSEVSNIVSSNKTVEDVTLKYVATESRVKALETEEARLLELLAQAKSMNDLLTIESRLTDVRTELEQVASTLKVYENQVDYGTVHLSVREVTEYTVTEEPTTVWGRIGAGFMNSLEDLGDSFVEFFVYVAINIPYILLIGVLGTGAILLIRLLRKKKQKKCSKKEEPSADKTE